MLRLRMEGRPGKEFPDPFFFLSVFTDVTVERAVWFEIRPVRAGGLGPPATKGSARVAHFEKPSGASPLILKPHAKLRKRKKEPGEFFPQPSSPTCT
jgi:hypothetical protein